MCVIVKKSSNIFEHNLSSRVEPIFTIAFISYIKNIEKNKQNNRLTRFELVEILQSIYTI